MTTTATPGPRPGRTDTRFFQLIADGVSRMFGYGVAVVGMHDGVDSLRVVAVTAGAHARLGRLADGTPVTPDRLLGTPWRVDELAATLADAADLGPFKFAGRARGESVPEAWVKDVPITDDLDRWHPSSALRAPIEGPDGGLIGMLSVDLPRSGRLPSPEQLELLGRFVEHTRQEILAALERERLAERARLLRTAREAVRRASTHPTLAGAIDEASGAILAGFGAVGLRVRIFDDEAPGLVRGAGERTLAPNDKLRASARQAAEELWRRGQVTVLGARQTLNPVVPEEEVRTQMLADLQAQGFDSLMHVPLGSGSSCLGALLMLRGPDAPLWTEAECAVALDIGRDLGQVLHRTRTQERQHLLIRDLSALDEYQSRLIATVATELGGPLRTIEESLERLGDPEQGIDMAAVADIEQGSRAMTSVVEDLLLLSRLAHPDDRPRRETFDLRALVRRTTSAAGAEAARRGLALSARLPTDAVLVHGAPDEIARLLEELIENALRYTASGGTTTVRVERHGDTVSLTVADDGIGIPVEDRPHVFTDFFRGATAREMAPAGAGLGMSIVERVVRRHDGTVEVQSRPGSGTLVRVLLPGADG